MTEPPLFKPPEATRAPHLYCCVCGKELLVLERPSPGTPGLCTDHARGDAGPNEGNPMDPQQVTEPTEPTEWTLEALLAKTIERARERRSERPGERELALVVTKLEEAALWLREWRAAGHLGDQAILDWLLEI